MASALLRLLGGKKRRPADLITGVAGPDTDGGGGWSVTWAGEGVWPPRVRAASLTEATDRAAAAVAALYAKYPPLPGAELQLALYPWDYRGGPMFDVTGQAGSFRARDIQGSDRSVSGATLEDLVEAVRNLPGLPGDDSMFRWIRPVASLPLEPTAP